ncbi:MAG TPA: hypothetical protein VD861_02755 [Pyrinomonadaceae bacterium]|nr:hypothetical protein [Pyrinomonadaceae bacterium]
MRTGHTGHAGTRPSHAVRIPSGEATLEGDLSVPVGANGVVLFAHARGQQQPSRS